jgi:hypothetical protein
VFAVRVFGHVSPFSVLWHLVRSNAVENRYHANHPSGPGRQHRSEPDTPFPFDDARTAFRANKTSASAGHYLHEALGHEFDEQISRDTFRNVVEEVARWLASQGIKPRRESRDTPAI